MTIEPITANNIKFVWELYQRNVAECDQLPLDWFRYKVLDDPDYDPESSLVAVESGRPVAFMDAVCRTWEGAPTGYLKAWATDPDYRDMGIATSLLERIEERFRALGAKVVGAGQAKPHYFTPGIDASLYTPAICFLHRRGFRYKNMGFNMDVQLDRTFTEPVLERRLFDKGIRVRRVEKSEKDRVAAWVKEFWGYSWQYQTAAAIDADPPAVLIAEKDGDIVGFVVYDAVRPGWFGPTGTLESMRGTGIGSALYLRCLDDMRDRGYTVCYICSVGPYYFYSKIAGAVISRTWWHMEKELF